MALTQKPVGGGVYRAALAAAAVVATAAGGWCLLPAQSPAPPRFDVVSIKELSPDAADDVTISPLFVGLVDPSEWRAHAQPLMFIIMNAYGVDTYNRSLLIGLPKWARMDLFEIVARVPPHARAAQIPLMAQAMLADRFRLKAHWEARPMPAAVMTVAPGGPKMRRDTACEKPDQPLGRNPMLAGDETAIAAAQKNLGCGTWATSRGNGMTVSVYRGFTMAHLAEFSSTNTLPALDRTQLKGAYDFTVSTPVIRSVGSTPEQLEDWRAQVLRLKEQAYRRQLGLNITFTKPVQLPVPVLVVTQVEKPTPN